MDTNPGPVILIVDDQPEFLEIFGTELRAAGYQVVTASSGADAIAEAKRSHPALILMDVQMPQMTGVETILKLKEDPDTKDIKVVFLTNLGNTDPISTVVNMLASQGVQAQGYIKKTEDLKTLLEEVKHFLA